MFRLLVAFMIIVSLAAQGQSLEIVSPKAIYQLGPSTLVNVDEGLYSHELIIADPSGRPIDRIRWSDHASNWDRSLVYKDHLVLIGVVGSSAEAFSILNTASKKNTLFALCRTPSSSPSGRYIGYLQFKPRSVGDTLDDIVLVLDLDHLPDLESAGVGWVIDSTNVGTVVYPRAYIGKKQFYNASNQASSSLHLIPLPPAWDSKLDMFVVVSKVAHQWFLISVDLTAGMAQRKLVERSLDIRQFLLEKSDDPVVLQRLQEELMINRVDVEDGIVSMSTAQISNIELREAIVPLR